LVPIRRGKSRARSGLMVGSAAQIMPVLASTADQAAAPTLSPVGSGVSGKGDGLAGGLFDLQVSSFVVEAM
ncbi:hypothetical protein GP486_005687, partial [Trichoglossum hirsutum]